MQVNSTFSSSGALMATSSKPSAVLPERLKTVNSEYRGRGATINWLAPEFRDTGDMAELPKVRRFSAEYLQEMARAANYKSPDFFGREFFERDLNSFDTDLWQLGDLIAQCLEGDDMYFSRVRCLAKRECPFLEKRVYRLLLVSRTAPKYVRPYWQWSVLDTIDRHIHEIQAEAETLITVPPSKRKRMRKVK